MPSTRSSAPADVDNGAAPSPSRRARLVVALIGVVVVVIIAAVTVVIVSGNDDTPSATTTRKLPAVNSAMVGEVAPDFAIDGLNGGTVRLSDYRGKPVVLNFWASWCTPCRKEFPLFRSTSAAKSGAYEMVGIDTGRDLRGDAQQFAAEQKADWPIGFDPDNQLARGYGVDPLPQTFFIRADGTIASHAIRGLTAAELKRELAKIGVK